MKRFAYVGRACAERRSGELLVPEPPGPERLDAERLVAVQLGALGEDARGPEDEGVRQRENEQYESQLTGH